MSRIKTNDTSRLTKEDIIRRLETFTELYKLQTAPFVSFWLSAGAALVLHGLRTDTDDIDLSANKTIWMQVFNKMPADTEIVKLDTSLGKNIVLKLPGKIDLHCDEHAPDISKFVCIDGIYCYSLEQMLEQKLLLNREKDQADIIALQKAIAERE